MTILTDKKVLEQKEDTIPNMLCAKFVWNIGPVVLKKIIKLGKDISTILLKTQNKTFSCSHLCSAVEKKDFFYEIKNLTLCLMEPCPSTRTPSDCPVYAREHCREEDFIKYKYINFRLLTVNHASTLNKLIIDKIIFTLDLHNCWDNQAICSSRAVDS